MRTFPSFRQLLSSMYKDQHRGQGRVVLHSGKFGVLGFNTQIRRQTTSSIIKTWSAKLQFLKNFILLIKISCKDQVLHARE